MMQDILFFILYIMPFIILILYRDRRGAYVFQITCANMLMLFYVVVDHIGLLWLYLYRDGVKQLTSINRETVILLAFYSLVIVVVYVTTGLALGSKCSAARIPDIHILRREKVNWTPILIVLLIAAPIAYLKFQSDSPLLILLSGDALAANMARVEAVTFNIRFLGIKASYLDVIFTVLSFASIIVLVASLVKNKIKYGFLYLLIVFVWGFYYFTNVSKGFIVSIMYIILITYSLIFAKGILINKALWWSLGFAVGIIGIFSAWVMGNEIVDFMYPFERLILGNLLPQYVVINSFGFDNLLHGTTVPWWATLGLHEQYLLDVFTWQQLVGSGVRDVYYTAPSSFVAEAHANFHFIGVLISSYFVFIALRVIDYFIKKIKSDMIYTAMMVHSSLFFAYMSAKGMFSFLVSYKYWAVLLFAFFFYRLTLTPKLKHSA